VHPGAARPRVARRLGPHLLRRGARAPSQSRRGPVRPRVRLPARLAPRPNAARRLRASPHPTPVPLPPPAHALRPRARPPRPRTLNVVVGRHGGCVARRRVPGARVRLPVPVPPSRRLTERATDIPPDSAAAPAPPPADASTPFHPIPPCRCQNRVRNPVRTSFWRENSSARRRATARFFPCRRRSRRPCARGPGCSGLTAAPSQRPGLFVGVLPAGPRWLRHHQHRRHAASNGRRTGGRGGPTATVRADGERKAVERRGGDFAAREPRAWRRGVGVKVCTTQPQLTGGALVQPSAASAQPVFIACEIKALERSMPILPAEFEILTRLGEGTFSTVYKARYRNRPSKLVALKTIYVVSGPSRLNNEVTFLKQVGCVGGPCACEGSCPRSAVPTHAGQPLTCCCFLSGGSTTSSRCWTASATTTAWCWCSTTLKTTTSRCVASPLAAGRAPACR